MIKKRNVKLITLAMMVSLQVLPLLHLFPCWRSDRACSSAAHIENNDQETVRSTKKKTPVILAGGTSERAVHHVSAPASQRSIRPVSRPKVGHLLQQRCFHCTDLFIQLCQTASLMGGRGKQLISASQII